MKISLKWLNDFIDVSEYFQKTEVLSDLLTKAGLEVEEVQDKSKDLKNVIVGHILVKDRHPNADKLSLCQVKVNESETLQIVCGAQNHKTGDKVVVALPGAVLPGNFAIKKSAIRGVESSGMLCSMKELGLAEASDGIAILDASAPIGESYAKYAGLDDIVFELKVTPNRADCLSHYGLAREVSCLIDKPLKKIAPEFKEHGDKTATKIQLEVQDSQLCPRYAGRFIRGVKIGPSPAWLKTRLESVGMNSINNVVDVTNYVMMEMGQPLHAFDAKNLRGARVIVKKANAGQKFKTLQETEITLTGEELMICDSEGPVALAGVIGGLDSGVSESTQDIFLESANFMAMSVRKSARRHGIETDSAYRFSRGVDASSTVLAMNRATELILQVAGGEALSASHDVYPKPIEKKPVSISIQTISDRLGYVADGGKFVQFMKGLGCVVKESGAGNFEVLPPTFRFDLEVDMDLVEEYARLHGYEHITETIPSFDHAPGSHDRSYVMNMALGARLRSEGYSQAFNYAFVGSAKQSQFLGDREALSALGLTSSEQDIRLLNPLNEEWNVMRSSLIYGLYKNMVHNFHQGNVVGRLFEIGNTFALQKDAANPYLESLHLGLLAWGTPRQLWDQNPQGDLVYELKAVVENLLADLKISAYTFQQKDVRSPAFAHPGQMAALIVEGKKVGFIATLHPQWQEEDKLRVPVALAEIDLEKIYQGQPRPLRVKPVSKFPAVERDFAFVMDEKIPVGEVQREIQKICGAGLLKKVEIFDLYAGDKLESGKKSVAFRLRLQADDGTLQEEMIQELSQKVIEGLRKQFALSIR